MEDSNLLCGYCKKTGSFDILVNHLFQCHPSLPFKFREQFLCPESGFIKLQSNLFKINPNDVTPSQLHVNSANRTLTVDELTPSKTPSSKRIKNNKLDESKIYVHKRLGILTDGEL